ncbi:glycosyltransferase family 2 protein [Gayadomonas joobiniege]|uniref:glycosyltransferase family 2 protein n=1 Tax=Gayadomonas joobiniege TaxID=1234606 RepID=UPI000375182C|nr:glycosyltransferase family 2 protein [Gayadomonas joobiniege]
MKVSFVIPHKGRLDLLIQTIESIWQQTGVDKEILLVSKNSDLTTEQLPMSGEQRVNLLIANENLTIAEQRNIGAAASIGEYLAFLDADIQLPADWAKLLIEKLASEPNLVMLSSLQSLPKTATWVEKLRANLANKGIEKAVDSLPGSNLILQRDTFIKSGGFPAHLTTCEDIYFTQAVAKLGEIKRTAVTDHIHLGEDKTLAVVFKKEIWRGQSNLLSLQGRKIPLREWPSLLVPFWVTLFLSFSIIFLPLTYMMFLGALVLWLLPIALYALRAIKGGRTEVNFFRASLFYAVYFPARCWGTCLGIFKTINIRQG